VKIIYSKKPIFRKPSLTGNRYNLDSLGYLMNRSILCVYKGFKDTENTGANTKTYRHKKARQ
jgi:hypothetical protein